MTASFADVGTPRFVGGTSLVPGTVGFTGTDITTGAAGNGWLCPVVWGNATDAPVSYPTAVWDFLADAAGGEGSYAADTGIRHASAFWTGTDITGTTQNFTNGGAADAANLIGGYVLRFTKTLTYWARPEVAAAADNTNGTTFSATFNRDPGFTDGDQAILVLVANTDAVNPASIALTLPGTTQGTSTTAVATTPTSQGNDARVTVRRVTITGTSNGTAPSVTATGASPWSGAALLVRIRDTNTSPTPAPVASVPADGIVEPWLSFPLDGSGSSYSTGATFAWSDVTSGGTGAVVIDDPTALVTAAHVNPTVWADEDRSFQLLITDAGGSSSATVTRTVLRSSEMFRIGGVDKPLRLTF